MVQGRAITLQLIEQIKLAYKDLQSQRKVAKLLSISRGTVQAVLNGRVANQRLEEAEARLVRKNKRQLGETIYISPMSVHPYRCKECGGLTELDPCMVCLTNRMRNEKARKRRERNVKSNTLLR